MHVRLQELAISSVRAGIKKFTVKLRLWPESANPDTDPFVVEKEFSAEFKTHVEGLTLGELLARAKPQAKADMQGFIDDYKQNRAYETNTTIIGAVSNLESSLVG